jgi:serine/threonine-protein kinase
MGACINEAERPTPGSFGVRLPPRAEAAFIKALAVDPKHRFHDMGAFWDELESAAGVSTPRITLAVVSEHDSVPPPAGPSTGQPSSLLTQVDATLRVPGAEPFPELTLGLPPAPSKRADRAGAPLKAKSPVAARAFDDHDDDMHISVLRSDAIGQLQSVPSRTPAARGLGPELAAGPRALRSPAVRAMPSEAPSMETVVARMTPGLRLLGAGVVLMIVDLGYAAYSGAAFSLGPVRALWIAGPLVGFGVIKLVLSLMG